MKILFAILFIHLVLGLFLPFRGYDKIVEENESIGIAEVRALVIQDFVFIIPNTLFALVVLLDALNKNFRLNKKKEIFEITASSFLLIINVLIISTKEFRGIDDFLKLNHQHLYLKYKI